MLPSIKVRDFEGDIVLPQGSFTHVSEGSQQILCPWGILSSSATL